ncbi:hypothetical protein CVT24_003988 [Panaeolus cyanescens]|uniref:BTB domain-containing protein n=1 Tax=Panaeolus cyanescens TaxID=181874 RepID=A0A409Y634_9AGAR|nr:hypothetical protein CVT24_003988 [Panaeolus cyanescens]
MPSITNTMHWLSRSATPTTSSSTTTSTSYNPSKQPVRISEPKLVRSLDLIAPRTGTLGAGATVVRTPDEALRETGVRLNYEDKQPTKTFVDKKDKKNGAKKNKSPSPSVASTLVNEPISPPCSPPLPPLPLEDSEESRRSHFEVPKSPPRPNRDPPPAPIPIPAPVPMAIQPSSSNSSNLSRRSSLKVRTISTSSREEEAPIVPPLPPHIAASTQPPPFTAILLSEPPSNMIDPSKLIITIETCTQTYKTTFATINSRPSHLSEYVQSILGRPEYENSFNSLTASVYSTASDDMATYRHHLTSQGLVPSTASLHIFLDRASAPYAHILNYLRTPSVRGQPETLPRALQILASNSPASKLDSLIEVRDEAAFLNLEGLHKLCTDEIRLRYGPRMHTRGNSASAASVHSLHASVYSMQTLLEHGEAVDDTNSISTLPATVSDPGVPFKGPSKSVKEVASPSGGKDSRSRSPPTPQSWEGPGPALQQRSNSRQSQSRSSVKSFKATPGGWI